MLLEQMRGATGSRPNDTVVLPDEETRAELRALGYVE
jgi:hypothetical protein